MAFALESNSKDKRLICFLYDWDQYLSQSYVQEVTQYRYHHPLFQCIPEVDERCNCRQRNTAVARCRDCNDVLVCGVCIEQHRMNCFTVELSTNFYGPVYEESLFFCEICKRYMSSYCKMSNHVSSKIRILKNEGRNEAKQHLNYAKDFILWLITHISRVYQDSPLKFHICDDILPYVYMIIQKYVTCKTLLDRSEVVVDIYNSKHHIEQFVRQLRPLINQLVQKLFPFIKQPRQPTTNHNQRRLPFINHPDGTTLSFPYPPLCLVMNQETNKSVINQFSTFTIHVRDVSNEPTPLDQSFVSIQCDKVDNFHLIPQDGHRTKFLVRYIPTSVGTINISVKILNQHVANSPLTVHVHVRDLTKIISPVAVFGLKGDGDGEFSRPWGVCCDAESRIIVADRSNHRVQVFNINGQFLFKFGAHGSDEGQFNLPVGVTVDERYCRIIVVDKDNHRVQLFTLSGEFVRTFGTLGTGNGQLNYPWDVAVNSAHQILVADSRNHRVQLFDFSGQFLSVCSAHIFNSPRGICFTHDDEILVSDFDFHYINVLMSDLATCSKIIGSLGEDVGQFNRPSGIAVDGEGNVVVVDSKNHRIQIFDSNGRFLHAFGANGSGVGEFNRPSDVCVSPEGKIVVVDFENSRVQIY